jgi:hypothetical protein
MKDYDLTPHGDGSLLPEPNRETNPAQAPTGANGEASIPSGEATAQPTISEARLRANRENAKKSTGPKTARGKAYSRRNALKHGMTAKAILFNPDGTPINPDMHEMWDALREKYGDSDVRTVTLIATIAVECFRQHKAMEHELRCFQRPDAYFASPVTLPNLQRYRTASVRAMLQSFALLEQQGQAGAQTPAAPEANEDGTASNPAVEPHPQPAAPQPSSASNPAASVDEQQLESVAPAAAINNEQAAPNRSIFGGRTCPPNVPPTR